MESRRRFLAGSVAACAFAVAGCNGDDGAEGNDDPDAGDGAENGTDPDDGSDADGDNSESDAAVGRYDDLIADTDERPINVVGQKPSELVAVEDFESVTADQQIFGLGAADVEYSLNVTTRQNNYAVVFGPFEFETVFSEVEGQAEEISELEAYSDFRTIEATAGESTFLIGIRDDVVINTTNREQYEKVIDAIDGNGPTLIGSDADIDGVAGVVGDPDLFVLQGEPTQLQIDPTGDAVAGGAGLGIEEGQSTYTAAVMYETETQATENESAVGDAAVEQEEALDSVETSVDGRMVIVRGDAETAAL